MLRAGKVGLRARDEADIAVLHAELYEDIATYTIADSRPWRPIPAARPRRPTRSASPAMIPRGSPWWSWPVVNGPAANWPARPCCGPSTRTTAALISVCRCGRRFRGRGLGTDVVLALCEYGFAVRGLHRLQVDTLASNAAMISAAVRAGFAQEGTLRGADWVNGEFVDEVILGCWPATGRGYAGRSRARWRTTGTNSSR
jgi:Acetyltransferases, including N-acetylases of ribosomal proteins